jgi:hypothetical protein
LLLAEIITTPMGQQHVCIGVVADAVQLVKGAKLNMTSAISNGFVFFPNKSMGWPSKSSISYGATYGSGSIVGVKLDFEHHTLSFFVNGQCVGVASQAVYGSFSPGAHRIVLGGVLRCMPPGSSLVTASGCAVRLTSCAQLWAWPPRRPRG